MEKCSITECHNEADPRCVLSTGVSHSGDLAMPGSKKHVLCKDCFAKIVSQPLGVSMGARVRTHREAAFDTGKEIFGHTTFLGALQNKGCATQDNLERMFRVAQIEVEKKYEDFLAFKDTVNKWCAVVKDAYRKGLL